MKNISVLNILLTASMSHAALAGATSTLSGSNANPGPKIIERKHASASAKPAVANALDGSVTVPVDVEVLKGQVYDPIDGVVYAEKEIRITPAYAKQGPDPVNTVTRAILNLSETGWTADQFDRLASELYNLQTLSLIGPPPSEKFLPGLRKIIGQVRDLSYNITVTTPVQRDEALDTLADLIKNGDSLRRLEIGDRLLLGSSSMSSIRGLRDALAWPVHFHYFRLLPTAQKHTAWKHEEVQRLGLALARAEHLKYVDISGNTLGYGIDGKANIREVFTTLAFSESLRAINAAKNNIGSKPDDVAKVEILVKQLRQMPNLQFIELSENNIEFGAKEKLELVKGLVKELKAINSVYAGKLADGERFLILSK